MSQRARRRAQGFSLSFLDVMCCGLGGVILVLMLVKDEAHEGSAELELLALQLHSIQDNEKKTRTRISTDSVELQRIEAGIEAMSNQIFKTQESIYEQTKKLKVQQKSKGELEFQIADHKAPRQQDLVQSPRRGEEEYLIGLKVKGKRIGILLDTSSSMTDEILVDVIRRKNATDKEKQSGPKWQRTKEIITWLLARLPPESEFVVLGFGDKAVGLGTTGWSTAMDPVAIESVVQSLNDIVPEGATNLQAGLNGMSALEPTNLYLITDGLPTKGSSNYRLSNLFSGCTSLTGTLQTITGECRVKLFRDTVSKVNLESAIVNVILLPIEGDPEAAKEFWAWASDTGGLLMSPARSWP